MAAREADERRDALIERLFGAVIGAFDLCGVYLGHRLGLYRNAYDDKLEAGESPSAIRMSYASLASLCAPGTCWSYQNIAYDASSEAVVASEDRYRVGTMTSR